MLELLGSSESASGYLFRPGFALGAPAGEVYMARPLGGRTSPPQNGFRQQI